MRYRVVSKIQFEFDLEQGDPTKEALKLLNEMLPAYVSFRVDRVVKPAKQSKITLGSFSPEEILPYLSKDDSKREYKVGNKSYWVRMNSHRYHMFSKSMKCAACGLEGNRFLLEQHSRNQRPHFNLYAEENGEFVLMTKDHIIPKSKNGLSTMKNYAVCCSICNNLKSNTEISYKGLGMLREIYNRNRRFVNRKELSIKIKEEREKILFEEME
jgi:hypothetical protein